MCNGWINKATWHANVLFGDFISEEIERLSEDYDFSNKEEVYEAVDLFENYMNEFFEEQLEQLDIPDWLQNFITIHEVRWFDLFMSKYESYIKDSIEDLQDDANEYPESTIERFIYGLYKCRACGKELKTDELYIDSETGVCLCPYCFGKGNLEHEGVNNERL